MSYTRCIANGMLCVSLFFLGSAAVFAENKGDVQTVQIEVKANIVGPTCQLVSNSPEGLNVDFGEVDIDFIRSEGSLTKISLSDQEAIRVECSHGSRAIFSVAAAAPKCEQDTNSGSSGIFMCGGPNKSIGMFGYFQYLDNKTNKVKDLNDLNNDKKLELKLKDLKGEIKYKSVLLATLKNVELTTGEVSAAYVLTIYSE